MSGVVKPFFHSMTGMMGLAQAKAPEAFAPTPPPAAPGDPANTAAAAARSAAEEEERRRRGAGGRASTVLTSPLGLAETATSARKTLLGE
jgi:hypothetical protein